MSDTASSTQEADRGAGLREYTVVMRAQSAVQFRRTEEIQLNGSVEGWGPVSLRFRTRYRPGPGATIPGDLWVEARGLPLP
jgi:hypothetical protein